MTKLSLVAILAVSAAFAGGDIAPMEPAVEAPAPVAATSDCNKDTTITGKVMGYYYTAEGAKKMFDKTNSQLAGAVTLDASHKLFEGLTANFSAVGYQNVADISAGYMEGALSGAFFNVANLTGTFGDTTFVAGRQLIDSPMFGGFDWLLAPGAFEAYTLVNGSISNVTLVGTYVRKWRDNNDGTFGDGSEFTKLSGDNYAFGAVFGADALSASVWYYNIDAYGKTKFTQVYGDAGYDFGSFNIAAQVVATNYGLSTLKDALAYGGKIGTDVSGINLTAAVNVMVDAATGYVGRDGLYTSTWNNNASTKFVANTNSVSWKVGAATKVAGADLSASYAGFDKKGSELDLIAGYDVTKSVNLGAVYSLTDNDIDIDKAAATSALEVFATYKF